MGFTYTSYIRIPPSLPNAMTVSTHGASRGGGGRIKWKLAHSFCNLLHKRVCFVVFICFFGSITSKLVVVEEDYKRTLL